jgi:superfamily II DNA or RNA helicase
MGVPAALERSRSGGGGHVWIFFDRAIPAIQARRLGSAILTLAMERRHQIGLDSYDRFFPNQDTLSKGGFGNLIALPLQRGPRRTGNSLFIDLDLQPYPDQWAFLAGLRRVPAEEVETIVREASRTQTVLGVRASSAGDDDSPDPWLLPPSRGIPAGPVPGPMPDRVRVVRGGLVYVEKEGLPPAMLNGLLRLAAFQNPEFHKAQAARLPTFGKPRVIGCGEDFPRHIGLPRGCFADALNLLRSHGIQVEVGDERFGGHPISVAFKGELTPEQQVAASAMMADDIGVLSAATAFGKTMVGAWLIATRNVNTLVLVHRRQLLDQWRARLAAGLGLPPKSIGQIGAGKTRPTGVIDVGILQSLNRKGEVSDLLAGYGQVIVDECHHVSAFSFERVLKQVRARYVVGLTATPVRKDGHHPIIIMQCGPIRFRADEKRAAAARPFSHVVIPRATAFRIPGNGAEPGIQSFQEVYAALLADEARNDLIFQDLVRALADGRSPLLLTERTAHLEEFDRRLRAIGKNAIILRGGMGAKQREAVVGQLAVVAEGEERVVLATGRYAGEGFDDPCLDTLFLAMPIAWRGTLQQYVGRLHRTSANKRVVQVYDYVDHDVPVLRRMYAKRLKGYAALGYTIQPGGALAKQLSLL